jgi:hypothetical protein
MNRLRTFLKISDPAPAARTLRQLSEYREANYKDYASPKIKERLFGLIARLEGASTTANTDALERFTPAETLEEPIGSIERDRYAHEEAEDWSIVERESRTSITVVVLF